MAEIKGERSERKKEEERESSPICYGAAYLLTSMSLFRPMVSVCQWRESILFLLRTRRRRIGRKRQSENYGKRKKTNGDSQREHEIQSKGNINATFHSLILPPPTHWLGFPMKSEIDVYSIIMQSVSAAFETNAVWKEGVVCSLGLWRQQLHCTNVHSRATPLQVFYLILRESRQCSPHCILPCKTFLLDDLLCFVPRQWGSLANCKITGRQSYGGILSWNKKTVMWLKASVQTHLNTRGPTERQECWYWVLPQKCRLRPVNLDPLVLLLKLLIIEST